MHLNTEGIVLREVEYSDADKLLDLLTKDRGLITVKARGVRRGSSTLKSACQLLAYSEFTLFEYKDRFTVNEAQPIEQFRELREDIELLSLGSYFAQASAMVAQEDAPNPQLLSLLLNALFALSRLKKPQMLVKAAFELRLACLAGFAPDLSGCAVCGNPEPDRFLLSQGELHCSDCAGESTEGIRLPVSPAVLGAMRYIVWCEAKKLYAFRLEGDALRSLNGITESYLMTQLEHSFSTLDFYKSLQSIPGQQS